MINKINLFSLNSLQLLELLNKILIHLVTIYFIILFKKIIIKDESHNIKGGIKEEFQENTANRICDFLKVLNYPNNYDM